MYWRDHAPHAYYGEYEVTVEIETGVASGRFPKRALRAVLEWLDLHKAELRAGVKPQCATQHG